MNKKTLAKQSDSPDSESRSLLADPAFLENLRKQMVKFATLQLSDSQLAEDAVQEALIGALKNADSFGGRAALKTWVFAILKNKIADVLRQKQRLINASSLLREDEEEDDLSALFDRNGYWQPDKKPTAWADPEESLREGRFWQVFEACLENLPSNQARVFMMREFIELDSHEICKTVGITISNLNVMLHRARLRLRGCLENRWFLVGERP
jgi:RNA polymerase sigma-70 factor (ECF subfamily)